LGSSQVSMADLASIEQELQELKRAKQEVI
jgi:hypothetical protein